MDFTNALEEYGCNHRIELNIECLSSTHLMYFKRKWSLANIEMERSQLVILEMQKKVKLQFYSFVEFELITELDNLFNFDSFNFQANSSLFTNFIFNLFIIYIKVFFHKFILTIS